MANQNQTTNPRPPSAPSYTRPADRAARAASATAQARQVFDATLNAGGTQSSAGSYDRRVGSATRNPR